MGAITAACTPFSTARSAASAATTVLPLPTSPCSRRRIGCASPRSRSISAQARTLRARQPERQAREQARGQRAGLPERRCGLALALAVMQAHRQLLRQQFVQLHAPPRRMGAPGERARVVAGPRPVQSLDRIAKRGHAQLLQRFRGQGFVEFALRQSLRDQAAQGGLRQPGGSRIDRRQRLGQRRVRAHDAIARVDHLRAEKPGTRFAEGAHARAGDQCLRLAAVEIEEAHIQKTAAVLDLAHQLAPRAVGDLTVDHRALDLHRHAFMRLGDGREPGFVLVTQRQMQHQIELAADAQFCEFRLQGRRSGQGRSRVLQPAGATGHGHRRLHARSSPSLPALH